VLGKSTRQRAVSG